MPKFEYTALTLNNKKLKGQIDARDEADLQRLLRLQELVPLRIERVRIDQTRYRLNAGEVAEFSRQLGSMLHSGITVVRALEIIKDRDFKPQILMIYRRLHLEVQQGTTLSEAMQRQGRAFPELLINMYKSGEESGQLERSAQKMAHHYDKENHLNGKVRTAMTYPSILFVVAVAVVILLFTVVLPEFFKIFDEMGTPLPLLTQMMMGISYFLRVQWYIPLGITVFLIFFIRALLRVESVRLKVDKTKLKLPIAGKLLKIIYTARFARTLASLYSSGLSMLHALEISATILGNRYVASQFPPVITDVRNGESLSSSVSKIHGFDSKLNTTILIGEESGQLDSMLDAVADSYDYEADQATSRLVLLIEPIMLVVMAVVVCTVMFSVVMPLMSLYQNIG